ncbi:MAG TPA: hypothetical protein VFS08_14560 [Gemmatimonadaceae bacterium]|nr:hypothetical protein [Gemmatimonadaceae bacterium]
MTIEARGERALLGAFLREGDEDALVALMRRVAPPLYRAARALTAWRVLGAQTAVERAWRVALLRAGDVDDDRGLWRVLWEELVRCAAAMGDSPRSRGAEAAPERAAAMRAVALLALPVRTVYALHDVGGAELPLVAAALQLPEPRVRAELWHARLAVETLCGTGTGGSAPEAPGEHGAVAPVWQEPVPDELLERMTSAARRRRAALVANPAHLRRVLPAFTTLVLVAGGASAAALWR